MSAASGRLRLTWELDAPAERVFRAFTDPEELVKWWGPAELRTSVAEIDLRPGGTCRWVMHPPEGSTLILHGRIVRVEPPSLLVMTNRWEGSDDETLVTVRFSDLGGRTRLDLIHERLPGDTAAFEGGWLAAMRELERYLAEKESEHMSGSDTRTVASRYFDAWTSRQGAEVLRPLMAEDFTFQAGPQRIEGREAFLAAGGWPEGATTTMQSEAYEGDEAFQLYEAVNGDRQIRVVEHLTVRDGPSSRARSSRTAGSSPRSWAPSRSCRRVPGGPSRSRLLARRGCCPGRRGARSRLATCAGR